MLKRLRRRVILLTMTAVVLVFVVILGTVNIVSHVSNEKEADTLLSTLAENGGTFPQEVVGQQETVTTVPAADSASEAAASEEASDAEEQTAEEAPAAENDASGQRDSEREAAVAGNSNRHSDPEEDAEDAEDAELAEDPEDDADDIDTDLDSTKHQEAGEHTPRHNWLPEWEEAEEAEEAEPSETPTPTPTPSPEKEIHYIFQQIETAETPYETRYFSVQFTEQGNLAAVDTGEIAAVSTEQATAMAEALLAAGRTDGYVGDYKYLAADEDGDTLYIFLDCTRNRQSERELLMISLLVSVAGILVIFLLLIPLSRRIIRPVAESYEKQKQFITNAGHEIKTPLAVINSCTEVLEMESDEPDNRWLQGIRSETVRLTELTKRMTALAKMDEGSMKTEMAELNLSQLASDLVADYTLLAEQKGLKLIAELDENLICRGNAPMLEELCVILLDNAVKYCAPEGNIRFSVRAKGRHAVIVCENPAEHLAQGRQTRAFDRFYRGDPSRSSQISGYGIGLSMAQSIVTAHHGKIAAESPDGRHFVITATLAK